MKINYKMDDSELDYILKNVNPKDTNMKTSVNVLDREKRYTHTPFNFNSRHKAIIEYQRLYSNVWPTDYKRKKQIKIILIQLVCTTWGAVSSVPTQKQRYCKHELRVECYCDEECEHQITRFQHQDPVWLPVTVCNHPKVSSKKWNCSETKESNKIEVSDF